MVSALKNTVAQNMYTIRKNLILVLNYLRLHCKTLLHFLHLLHCLSDLSKTNVQVKLLLLEVGAFLRVQFHHLLNEVQIVSETCS